MLFTKNTKYLAHVISKGVKGDFDPILAFLNSIIDNMPTLLQHLDNDETKQYLTSFLQVISLINHIFFDFSFKNSHSLFTKTSISL